VRVRCLDRAGFRVLLRRRVVRARIRSSMEFAPGISAHIAQIIDRRGCHDQRRCEYNFHNALPFPQMGRRRHLSRTPGRIYGAWRQHYGGQSTALWRLGTPASPTTRAPRPPLVHTSLARSTPKEESAERTGWFPQRWGPLGC
jgi:hypothetical protein